MDLGHDQRGIVMDYFVKVILGLTIGAIILFDSGSIVVNRLTAGSTAQDIAAQTAAAVTFSHNITQQGVTQEAESLAEEFGVKLLRAELDREGIIHIEVRKQGSTILAGKIGPLKQYTRATGEAQVDTDP